MGFSVFCKKCKEILEKSGESKNGTTVNFSNEDGKYTAYFSNGVQIKGNATSLKVGVYWGSGHKAVATI